MSALYIVDQEPSNRTGVEMVVFCGFGAEQFNAIPECELGAPS